MLSYVSIAILVIGMVFFIINKTFKISYWFPFYFGTLLGLELLSNYNREYNLYLFSIASFLNFAFLVYYYLKNFIGLQLDKIIPVILIGTIPMILGLSTDFTSLNFQSYDRFIYSLLIMILCLYTFYSMLNQEEPVKREQIVLNSAVILFFTVDSFLAIGTNYLVNESLMLVNGFWMLRAILLQIFYGSIIYYAWQIGKTR